VQQVNVPAPNGQCTPGSALCEGGEVGADGLGGGFRVVGVVDAEADEDV
jgi:hypothetical protein